MNHHQKNQQRRVDALNNIIHHRNLYIRSAGHSERVIEAHLDNGAVAVRGLYTGRIYPVEQSLLTGFRFYDGHGRQVVFDTTGIAQ